LNFTVEKESCLPMTTKQNGNPDTDIIIPEIEVLIFTPLSEL
jgi:hypothetical protein